MHSENNNQVFSFDWTSKCSYEEDEMKKRVLHMLVLSHSFSIPSLKRVCVHILEQGWLTTENIVDVLQLAKNCDAPRLCFICIRMIVKNFKHISKTDGWKVMKHVNPALEQELLELVVEADSVSQLFSAYFSDSMLMQVVEKSATL